MDITTRLAMKLYGFVDTATEEDLLLLYWVAFGNDELTDQLEEELLARGLTQEVTENKTTEGSPEQPKKMTFKFTRKS